MDMPTCCGEVIKNSAAGKEFFYCRECKKEVGQVTKSGEKHEWHWQTAVGGYLKCTRCNETSHITDKDTECIIDQQTTHQWSGMTAHSSLTAELILDCKRILDKQYE